ncbi:MoaD/ThiS family protein [Salinirubellus salinus]|uniref:MoaD/ThiS family protein n=1 Tax=Salinirubellus salinus TaxID=1364945 RepID=A0A9E7R1Y8_9EURY|nr:MoaD/ThiS family protein [Salinirubellus salinus]UWM53155.1 MoaD/ThiS family protein [Salinirubellus salinus]
MSTQATDPETRTNTTVDVKATGHVRRALEGEHRFEFTFEGTTLREFLEAFFEEHPGLAEMLVAETEADATPRGWVRRPESLPGTWRKNPEGEQTRPYARVLVNGKFNEHLGGFDTELSEGDRVALVYPFMYCC